MEKTVTVDWLNPPETVPVAATVIVVEKAMVVMGCSGSGVVVAEGPADMAALVAALLIALTVGVIVIGDVVTETTTREVEMTVDFAGQLLASGPQLVMVAYEVE